MQPVPGLTVAAVLLLVMALSEVVLARRSRARAAAALRSRWGRRPPDPPIGAAAAALDELLEESGAEDRGGFRVDDRTWSDLDLDQVFVRLDRCTSQVGSQVLYRLLRRPQGAAPEVEAARSAAVALAADGALRESVQLSLRHLREGARLAEMLWRPLPPVPGFSAAAPLLVLAAVLVPLLALAGLLSPAWMLPLFAVNTGVHLVHRRRIESLPLAQLAGLARAGEEAATIADPCLASLTREASAAAVVLRRLRRRLTPLAADEGLGLLQYLKIYLLLDVLAYARVAAVVRRHRIELQRLLLALGRVDALLAVESFRVEHPDTCRPTAVEDPRTWAVTGAWHPLLERAIANDLVPRPPAILLTGSNMAGKTTYLKTIGVNAVLARALGVACAAAWELPPLDVLTSIGRADNLIEGRSYYLAEVESILRLVRAAESPTRHLFIADEMFRGTNPEERVAGAAEVLGHLARGPHLVLAATHDHELVELLAGRYACYHFAEALTADGLSFDYRLRNGPARTRNALALLEQMGYPADLVARARRRCGSAGVVSDGADGGAAAGLDGSAAVRARE